MNKGKRRGGKGICVILSPPFKCRCPGILKEKRGKENKEKEKENVHIRGSLTLRLEVRRAGGTRVVDEGVASARGRSQGCSGRLG